LADRHSKRKILLITQTCSMTFAFVLAFAVLIGGVEPWLIICIAILNGSALGFDMPARQSFMVELVGRKDLINAVSLNSSVVNGARIVGPSLAGLLLGSAGAATCFFLNALSYVAVIISLWRMDVP